MSNVAENRAAPVAAVLRELLLGRTRYRRQWQRWVQRQRSGISRAGVSRVIEDYLVVAGEASEFEIPARQLKDRVSRALTGERISLATLRLFVDAFGMAVEDEARLLAVYSTQALIADGISGTLRYRRPMVRAQDHRTVSIVERYLIDAEKRLYSRRTQQTIKALRDDVGVYIFNHEPSADVVDVVHGGKPGRRLEYGDGLVAVEILLESPLARHEATALEYRTTFKDSTVISEVRRAAFVKAEHVDFAVEFDAGALPGAAWWCAWDDHLEGRTVYEEPVAISRRAIRKFVPFVEQSVVGFKWAW